MLTATYLPAPELFALSWAVRRAPTLHLLSPVNGRLPSTLADHSRQQSTLSAITIKIGSEDAEGACPWDVLAVRGPWWWEAAHQDAGLGGGRGSATVFGRQTPRWWLRGPDLPWPPYGWTSSPMARPVAGAGRLVPPPSRAGLRADNPGALSQRKPAGLGKGGRRAGPRRTPHAGSRHPFPATRHDCTNPSITARRPGFFLPQMH